ncbi:hypothetical protein [Halorubrum distributum]|uniref:hypothetical protein n=1 Tax=Halorubrum distributum TaxID=29283 RepID=UPI001267DB2C|nr:hypothetical protein [Halorubrum terrestre]
MTDRGGEKVKQSDSNLSRSSTRDEDLDSAIRQDTGSGTDQNTVTKKSVNLDYDIQQNGTIGLSFEIEKEYDIANRFGEIGGLLVSLGIIISITAPILYIAGIIPNLALLTGVISLPFAAGSGLIALSDRFEYFPGT